MLVIHQTRALMKPFILLPLSLILAISAHQGTSIPSCNNPIYCQGDLLHTIQMAKIYDDSKTFVDMKLKFNATKTLDAFDKFKTSFNGYPTKNEILKFVETYFEPGNELQNWIAPDYKINHSFLNKIQNKSIRKFAKQIIKIWPTLARKMKSEVYDNKEMYSFIPLPNGFIIPGGRFKEIYYWDTYWIIKGLLLSEMTTTTKGILDNFISIVERYGFVPNGGRIYYLNRSQPPMLSLMAELYIKATNDLKWLRENINTLEQELDYWLKNKLIDFRYGTRKYTLAHYYANDPSPRPESYSEDVKTCNYSSNSKKKCYVELKTAAESGWDFSSRWFFNRTGGNANTNLTDIRTSRVIPVDLNSILARAFQILAHFQSLLGNKHKQLYWAKKSKTWIETIETTMYNEKDGIWYDIDAKLARQRNIYSASNFAPLWAELYIPQVAKLKGKRAAAYFSSQGLQKYEAGIPTTLINTGEQWDFPNAWPPLQSIVILGLKRSGDHEAQKIATEFANRWINSNKVGYKSTNHMYEKYNAITPGALGYGGEYNPQLGFGWSNGVVLELIDEYFTGNNNQ